MKKILVPIDGSDASRAAAETAVELGKCARDPPFNWVGSGMSFSPNYSIMRELPLFEIRIYQMT